MPEVKAHRRADGTAPALGAGRGGIIAPPSAPQGPGRVGPPGELRPAPTGLVFDRPCDLARRLLSPAGATSAAHRRIGPRAISLRISSRPYLARYSYNAARSFRFVCNGVTDQSGG